MPGYCQLYGIISPEASLPEGLHGFQGQPLQIVKNGEISALISIGRFETGQNPALILELFKTQLQILEQVNAVAVLPTRFGTGVSSTAMLEVLLNKHQQMLAVQLQAVNGMAQFNLTAIWNLNTEIALAASNQDVQEFRSELQTKGQILLEDQARIGELISMHLEHERQRLMDKVLLRVEPLLHEYGLTSRDQEEIAFNMALLAERNQEKALIAGLQNLQQEMGERIGFQLSSPQVASAFRLLEVIEPRATDLEKARLTLRLPANTPSATGQIQRAYKTLALERHPDRRPDSPTANDEMQELAWARELLELADSGIGVRILKMINA